MKKLSVLLVVLGVIVSWSLLSSHSHNDTLSQLLANQKLNNFKKELNQFNQLVINWNEAKVSKKSIQLAYKQLRNSYKQIEFLLEFTDPALVKDNLNGAPLPHLDKTAPSLLVLNPVGLQVLDELLQEPKDSITIQEIKFQSDLLFQTMQSYQWQTKIYDRYIFEGAFIALIRLFNLGLTGFDTPGSLHGIEDSKSVLISLKEFLALYQSALDDRKPGFHAELMQMLSSAIQDLNKSKGFNEFNRYAFLVNHLNPLINQFKRAKHLLQIETMEEVNPNQSALNYEANGLFDPNLLQKDFYLKLPVKYRNEKTIALGKLLFYDPILSANNARSCGSCHNPSLAFTDGLQKSRAFKSDTFIQRNAPSLINSVYAERFFYDLRAGTLEDQTEHVIFSKEEFNTSYFDIFDKLNGSKTYAEMFKQTFPDFNPASLNRTTLSYALAAYVGSITSFSSPFDLAVQQGAKAQLSKQVINGFNLFMGKAACGTCHFAPVFNGTTPPFFFESESEVLGVPEDASAKVWKLDGDKGRADGRYKENIPFYEYSFKTVTVRNTALTKPYMHNGSFLTLEDVVDFYNNGGGAGKGLSVPHQTLASDKLNLSKNEIVDLLAFMNSLNDSNYHFEMPATLPAIELYPNLNNRIIGGSY
jgi:cytochrome c peroxidase